MTNLQNCLDSCSIYVGTYLKYNNGSLYGKWLNLADYSDYDGLIEAMKDLHEDENEPEFMLQDHELCEIFEKLGLIGESYIFKDIYEIAEQINDSGYDIEVFESYVDCVGKMDFQNVYDGVMNYYIGEYQTMKHLYKSYAKMIHLTIYLRIFVSIGKLLPVTLCLITLSLMVIISVHRFT